jgi:hypothetical protein
MFTNFIEQQEKMQIQTTITTMETKDWTLLPQDIILYILEFHEMDITRYVHAHFYQHLEIGNRPVKKHSLCLFGYFSMDTDHRKVFLIFRSVGLSLKSVGSPWHDLFQYIVLPAYNLKNLRLFFFRSSIYHSLRDSRESIESRQELRYLFQWIQSNRNTLEVLNLCNCIDLNSVDDDSLRLLSDCKKLKTLKLSLTNIQIQRFEEIFTKLNQIKNLSLEVMFGFYISGIHLPVLKPLTDLETLRISYNQLTENDIIYLLKEHKKLKTLSIQHSKFTNASRFNTPSVLRQFKSLFSIIANHESLTNINMRDNSLPICNEDLLSPLTQCKNIKAMDLGNMQNIQDFSIANILEKNSTITHLDISGNRNLTVAALEKWKENKSLKYLNISQLCLSTADILKVLPTGSSAKNLVTLVMKYDAVDDQVLEHISKHFINLQKLSIHQSMAIISDNGVKHLFNSNLMCLEMLDLSNNIDITNETANFLSQVSSTILPNLRTLDLSSTSVRNEGVKLLFMNQQYETLFLRDLLLTDECLEPLKWNHGVKYIDLSMNLITSVGAELLLFENQTLLSIILKNNKLNSDCLAKLAMNNLERKRSHLLHFNVTNNEQVYNRESLALCDWIEEFECDER